MGSYLWEFNKGSVFGGLPCRDKVVRGKRLRQGDQLISYVKSEDEKFSNFSELPGDLVIMQIRTEEVWGRARDLHIYNPHAHTAGPHHKHFSNTDLNQGVCHGDE